VPFLQLCLAPGAPAAVASFLDTAYWMSSVVVKLAQADSGARADAKKCRTSRAGVGQRCEGCCLLNEQHGGQARAGRCRCAR